MARYANSEVNDKKCEIVTDKKAEKQQEQEYR